MVKRYEGGCAIMLKVPVESCPRMFAAAVKWVAHPWVITPPADYHLTLQFVGRDLDGDKIGAAIYSTFLFARDPFPVPIEFVGTLGILATRKGRYMVAHVRSDNLKAPRKRLQNILGEMGVVTNDPFDFNPHVTLAEAPPDTAKAKPPDAIGSFSARVNQIEVKYGPHRMVVEL